jgi:streptogramin lyase
MRTRWMILSLGLIIAVLCANALSVSGESVMLTIWELPYERAFPAGIALDSANRVAVATSGGREVYRLDPTTNTFRSWGVGERPASVAIIDDVIFCSVEGSNQFVYFNPESLGVSTWVLPFSGVGPRELEHGITTSQDTTMLWMTEWSQLGVLRMEYDPAAHFPGIYGVPSDSAATPEIVSTTIAAGAAVHEQFSYNVSAVPEPYTVSTVHASPPFKEWVFSLGDFAIYDVAPASDGKVWISFGAPFLLRLDPEKDTLQEIETIPNALIFNGLLAASDGSIWFADLAGGAIGHLDLALGISESWRIPGSEDIYDLAFTGDHEVWYTDRLADTIGHLNLATSEFTVYSLPDDSEPLYLKIDGNGDIWFSAGTGNYIGRLSPGQ